MPKERSYLDWNATAPLLDGVQAAVVECLGLPGNPSSVHQDGRAARAKVNQARRQVAALVGADPAHVTFTSGATEAAAHVLTPRLRMGRAALPVSKLYVAATEHPCVLAGGRFASEQIEILPVDGRGVLDLDRLKSVLAAHNAGSGAAMVAVMLANNESGVIQPIPQIAALVREAGGILVADAVQAATRIPVDIEALGTDFLILSGHKMGAPKGVGALVSRGEMLMPEPLIPGGGQEKGHRSGTENLSGIVGFGAAAHIGLEALNETGERARRLQIMLEEGIRNRVPGAVIVGEDVDRLPNTTFFAVPGLKAETAQIAFDLEGISVSAGSACSSGKVGESHVLKAMGLDAANGAIRVSTGPATSDEDIARFLDGLESLVTRQGRAAA